MSYDKQQFKDFDESGPGLDHLGENPGPPYPVKEVKFLQILHFSCVRPWPNQDNNVVCIESLYNLTSDSLHKLFNILHSNQDNDT